ncbi:MAG: hypothetical protein SWJ54_25410 [Cyanobacteriota bacterium]|nr:hypothetical protein [Cyanobacteriota bacterium]
MFIYDQQGAIALGRQEGLEEGKRNIAQTRCGIADNGFRGRKAEVT